MAVESPLLRLVDPLPRERAPERQRARARSVANDRARDTVPLVALTLAWAVVVLLVDPRGRFPLNDDWAYGSVALGLAERGRLEPSFWQSMPLVTHALWGAAFVRMFGASWFALRLSSLVAGWLAVTGAYMLLREVGWRRAGAAAGAALLLANPWLVALSFTFMTDVPFTAAAVWGAWAWLRAIGRRDARWLALAAALGVAATLSRQVGLALPLAFAVPLVRRRAFGRRSPVAALAPLVAAAVALAVHDHWRHAAAVSAALYDAKSDALARGAAGLLRLERWDRVGARVALALAYLGLFVLPATLVSGGSMPGVRRRGVAGNATYTLGALGGIAVLAAGWSMPLTGNVVIDAGIGPRTLAGELAGAPVWLWRALTIAAGIGAAFLIRAVAAGWRAAWRSGSWDGSRWRPIACALVAATLFIPSAVADTTLFDRHLLVLLPLLLAAMPAPVEADPRRAPIAARTAAVAAGLALAAFSVAATHDYLAWHRARWSLVRALEASALMTPTEIQAGLELDNLPSPELPATELPATTLADRSDAPYVVSMSLLPGHDEVMHANVRAWLPGAVRAVYVLARPTAPPSSPRSTTR